MTILVLCAIPLELNSWDLNPYLARFSLSSDVRSLSYGLRDVIVKETFDCLRSFALPLHEHAASASLDSLSVELLFNMDTLIYTLSSTPLLMDDPDESWLSLASISIYQNVQYFETYVAHISARLTRMRSSLQSRIDPSMSMSLQLILDALSELVRSPLVRRPPDEQYLRKILFDIIGVTHEVYGTLLGTSVMDQCVALLAPVECVHGSNTSREVVEAVEDFLQAVQGRFDALPFTEAGHGARIRQSLIELSIACMEKYAVSSLMITEKSCFHHVPLLSTCLTRI